MKPHFRITSFLFLAVILFSTKTLVAQHILSGKITDERNRQPLAFVNVVVNEGLQGVISDIDGRYEITSSEPISRIKVSSIGPTMTREQRPAPHLHAHGDLTSLTPEESLPELPVVPLRKPHSGTAARENPRYAPVITR